MFQNIAKFTYKTSLMTCSCLCAASFAARADQMQCLNVNCESLGYTNVSDLGDTNCNSFLTCPYDPRYIKCDLLPTCENLGFTKTDKTLWCTNLVRCPTDPSYTLCRSLCSECPEGTALDPEELGCEDGYEAAQHLVRPPRGGRPVFKDILNDCGYTCYKCSSKAIDVSYYCEDEADEAFINCIEDGGDENTCSCEVSTSTNCSAGTYISEVRHAADPSLPDRYICKPCPTGLTNSGVNNYTCECDTSEGYYSTPQNSWGNNVGEVHFAFGTCYVERDNIVCGEGILSDYIYSEPDDSLVGHTWTPMTDGSGNVCYKTSCSGSSAFQTAAACRNAYSGYGVICKDDGYSCYVFDKCNDSKGYLENVVNGGLSCVCNTTLYPYMEDDGLPDYAEVDYDSNMCEDDEGEHYSDFSCPDPYQRNGTECQCADRFKYLEDELPNYASPAGESCTDNTRTYWTSFDCDPEHKKVGEKCMCPDGYISEGDIPSNATPQGECRDSDGNLWYDAGGVISDGCESHGYTSYGSDKLSSGDYKCTQAGEIDGVVCYECTDEIDAYISLDYLTTKEGCFTNYTIDIRYDSPGETRVAREEFHPECEARGNRAYFAQGGDMVSLENIKLSGVYKVDILIPKENVSTTWWNYFGGFTGHSWAQFGQLAIGGGGDSAYTKTGTLRFRADNENGNILYEGDFGSGSLDAYNTMTLDVFVDNAD